MTDFIAPAEPAPWATMTRAELIDRLTGVAQIHSPLHGLDAARCLACDERHPCSTFVVATGAARRQDRGKP